MKKEELDVQIQKKISTTIFDPNKYVEWNFPWGETGTRLVDHDGADAWQREVMDELGSELKLRAEGKKHGPVQIARASGHGIGKTALVAWIIKWFMSTRPHPQIVTTANTKQQLDTKTWRELQRWNEMAIDGHYFRHNATSFVKLGNEKTWRANAVPWSKENSEAFAGTHEDYVLMIFDEASNIDDVIYEVAEGAMMTGKECIWLCFGNPTRNSGRFYNIFHGKVAKYWLTKQIDARDCKIPMLTGDNQKHQELIETYGEDSDIVKVRVRGLFPDLASMQFIPTTWVKAALGKSLPREYYDFAPRLIGVDVARYGDDQSVLIRRQGLSASGMRKFSKLDTMELASIIAQEAKLYKAHAIFVDVIGIGAGVVDRLRELGFTNVFEVNGAEKPGDDQYANKRAECWGNMKNWLKRASVPDDYDLFKQLITLEFCYDMRNKIRLERKEDLKNRGEESPDCADALAYTFAFPVMLKEDELNQLRSELVEKARKNVKNQDIKGFPWQHKQM